MSSLQIVQSRGNVFCFSANRANQSRYILVLLKLIEALELPTPIPGFNVIKEAGKNRNLAQVIDDSCRVYCLEVLSAECTTISL